MEGVDFVTKEHRIIFGLSDLKSFRFVCRKCKGGTMYPVSAEKSYPTDQCPHCKTQFGFGAGEKTVDKLIEAMQKVIANDDNLKVDLKFEMEDQSSEEPEK